MFFYKRLTLLLGTFKLDSDKFPALKGSKDGETVIITQIFLKLLKLKLNDDESYLLPS